MTNVRTLPTRRFAHPFDRPVKVQGDEQTHGVDASPDAIGGCYGMGWREAFRCHKSGQVYAVHCSDGMRSGKSAHSDRDLAWMEAMRSRIVARTRAQSKGPIVLSPREWAIMLNYTFGLWLDPLPGEEFKTVGDANRHLDEGQIGTIGDIPVIVDPKATDDLPKVGDFAGEAPLLPGSTTATPRHEPSRFEGVFAAAFAKAGLRAS